MKTDNKNYDPCTEDDEIDLRELISVLKKRKRIVLFTTSVVVLLAVLYILLSHRWYEAKATLEIGYRQITTNSGEIVKKYFDDPERIKHYLDVKYDTSGKFRKKGTKSYLKSVSVPRKSKYFVSLTSYGMSNKLAEAEIKNVLNDIMATHKEIFRTIIIKKENQIDKSSRQLEYYKNVVLPQLKNRLNIVKTIDLKKIDTQINLIKTIDLKKIDTQINFLKNTRIPILKEKIKSIKQEIIKKQHEVNTIENVLQKIAKQDPALGAIDAMQIANLQNDIDRLTLTVLDLNVKAKSLTEESIPNLEKQKQKILEQTIPNLEKQKQKILEQTIPNLEKQKQKILEQTIPNLQAQKEKLYKETIPTLKGNINKLINITIPALKNSIQLLKLSEKPPYLVMTRVVGGIRMHNYPAKPKKKLVLVVAFITGLILGFFLAFLVEFIMKPKEVPIDSTE